MERKYYVTMIDSYLSGWGKAEGLNAKFIYVCDTYNEAQIVYDNAIARGDQRYVNICLTRPKHLNLSFGFDHYYLTKGCVCKVHNKETAPNWYKEGFWR